MPHERARAGIARHLACPCAGSRLSVILTLTSWRMSREGTESWSAISSDSSGATRLPLGILIRAARQGLSAGNATQWPRLTTFRADLDQPLLQARPRPVLDPLSPASARNCRDWRSAHEAGPHGEGRERAARQPLHLIAPSIVSHMPRLLSKATVKPSPFGLTLAPICLCGATIERTWL
jgi:hypothetical protein